MKKNIQYPKFCLPRLRGRPYFQPLALSPQPSPRRGFTLIELILVITILSILMALLFASLKAVRRYSREVSTRTELGNLEAAFRQFYDHYGYWPIPDNIADDDEPNILLNRQIINTLGGRAPEYGDFDLNPDRIPFFEIARIRRTDGNQQEAVSAWGDTYGQPYYVKFDTNGDNTLDFSFAGHSETIHRSVIVWTEHPDRKNSGDTPPSKRILCSWQQ